MTAIQIDLWRWPLTAPDPRNLSRSEMDRADRFVFARDRDRFIAGRAKLREILGGYLNKSPSQLDFLYGAHGKPQLAGLDFNLSHTGDLAVLAVAQDVTLGIDIEAIKPIDMAVARSHFAPSEIEALRQLPSAEKRAAFYRCWTRKEAYLKARGTGLMTDLNSFSVTLDATSARLVSCATGTAAAWTLIDLSLPDGIAGAFAVQAYGQGIIIVNRRLD